MSVSTYISLLLERQLTCVIVALGLAICIASLGVGYTIGSRTSAHHTSYIERTKAPLPAGVAPVPEPEEESDDSDDDSDDDDYKENTADGDFSVISAGYNEPCKMVCCAK